jgi:hypothetical protein
LKQFDKLVSSDLLAKSPFAREILRCQERVRSEWEKLLEHANSRELKLDSAEELHKFNRDSTELNDRLRQKLGSISDEPFGRDAKHAFSLIVAHEVFEKEITQLHVEVSWKYYSFS